MPHIIVEHSSHIADKIEIRDLLRTLHDTLGKRSDANINPERITTRAQAFENHIVGGPESPDLFIHITLKILPGRSPELQKDLAHELQNTAKALLAQNNIEARVTACTFVFNESYCK